MREFLRYEIAAIWCLHVYFLLVSIDTCATPQFLVWFHLANVHSYVRFVEQTELTFNQNVGSIFSGLNAAQIFAPSKHDHITGLGFLSCHEMNNSIGYCNASSVCPVDFETI